MSEQTPGSASGPLQLPDAPNLEWLRKQAKHNLESLRQTKPGAQLSDAQLDLARRYGFPSWRTLKSHIDSLTIDGQLFDAARKGDVGKLTTLLDENPDKLYARTKPYEHTMLHLAAHNGQLGAVDFLLKRGIDPSTREKGDNTYAMHWAAAAGHIEVAYAMTPEIVRPVVDAMRDRVGPTLLNSVAAADWDSAERLMRQNPNAVAQEGVLHLMAKTGNVTAVKWLLAHGADPNARWNHWNDLLTALHLAVLGGHPDVTRALLAAGADSTIRDTEHDSDALGWARFFLEHRGDSAEKRWRGQEIIEMVDQARSRPARR